MTTRVENIKAPDISEKKKKIRKRLYKSQYLEMLNLQSGHIKVDLSPSKNICSICFNESPFKMMKNAF